MIFFISGLKKKIYQIKFLYYFYFIIFVNFLSYYNGVNVDSPMYHLQSLNWMILNKINLGITNLNIRFGLNSSWHSFLALSYIPNLFISLKFYLSSIIFSILIYSSLFKKKYLVSDVFIFLSTCFLLTYSFLHPFVNGPILNQLGNPEVDTVAMILYILSFYYFLKLNENNLSKNDTSINFFVVLIFLAITVKISNLSLIFLLLGILISNKNYKILNFSNIFVFITGIFWLIRGYLISGCLIFPIKLTCLETQWTNLFQTDLHNKIIQSFSRDTRLRQKYMDFDHTLYSNDWLLPWFKDYFINTAILKISSLILLISIFVLFILYVFELFKKIKLNIIDKFLFNTILVFFIISIYVWLRAPEVRFGSGLIITLPCFFLTIVIHKLDFKKYINYASTLICIIVLLSLFFYKHSNKFNLNHLIVNDKEIKDFRDVKKIYEIEGVEIFQSKNWRCGDFPKICVNKKKNNYEIIKKFNYRMFVSDNK